MKYLKYKTKYQNLKTTLLQLGSGNDIAIIIAGDKTSVGYLINGQHHRVGFDTLKGAETVGQLKELIKKVIGSSLNILNFNSALKSNIPISNNDTIRAENNKLIYNNKSFNSILVQKTDVDELEKFCAIDDMMNMTQDRGKACPNKHIVQGSCSHPSFWESQSDYESKPNVLYWKEFVERILNYYNQVGVEPKPEGVEFILGATTNMSSTHPLKNSENGSNILKIYMNPFYKPENENENLDTKIIYIAKGFPLSGISNTDKLCIGLISRLSSLGPVHITNRICGSCFSSFYSLVHKYKFSYTVNPEQKISENDKQAINKKGHSISNCFTDVRMIK